MFAIEPPPNLEYPRNGWTYGTTRSRTERTTRGNFTPQTLEINESMGVIPETVLNWPGHVRGNHPLDSFTAIGPDAEGLVAGQSPENVYAPLLELTERNGSVILMGVGLETMTLLHLAEMTAGRQLFRRWANDTGGQAMVVQAGGCSQGFGNLAPVLAPITQTIQVGQSKWSHLLAREALALAVDAIRRDPQITHCADAACERCNDAVAGGPIIDATTH
jgi:aminoglycoside 3-N-acetyltransferase